MIRITKHRNFSNAFLQTSNLNVKHEAIQLMTQHFSLLFILKYYYLLPKKKNFLQFLFLINLVHELVESTITEAAITLIDGKQRHFQGFSQTT